MTASSRAPWACDPARSRGRLHPEPESAHRSPFQRDRDRIIHSSAFRRLKHKTQVFVEHEGDYYRTRLTHSLEVAQVARTISRTLGLDEELAEAVALAHDLGHPPFGHTGEDALHACMAPYGGFDHNAQALKIVTELETRYAEFDGLNLTWETLEGIAKHNGPPLAPGMERDGLPPCLAECDARHGLELTTHASAEAQVAALSDDIAYNNHDLDDGLRAGLFTLDEARALPIVGPCFAEVERRWPGLEPQRLQHEALRRVFGVMVEDVLCESRRRLEAAAPRSAQDVREAGAPMIAFSDALREDLRQIRAFLFTRMYRHWKVRRMRRKAAAVVRELFAIFMDSPGVLPDDWRLRAEAAPSEAARARVVADYIAGMTDRFALQEHKALTDPQARV
ncbi:deoxyguanosinetriphosphate triphosphohydrolase [Oceanicella actignis]|uniref:deoxyguanosinetriphosphate triphosphohydrolase n=1 Tax=Oceanicella actignis TaxID=1189325 RepID=UPI0011E60C8A|nr:deoxyguanosinetriphosphate triphosphohydrolase [Oceanicella actignis]TYO91567.1 dGTPase [Oceanicella actignis]